MDKFKKYYQKNKLFSESDKVLLTVSGGKDSMAMLHLFKSMNLSFGVAHCNFQLRGEDANKDEAFVRDFCASYHIEFHVITFKTKEYAIEKGISIQMAARDLRYAWFEKIRKENNYKYIATAHHKNDIAETMLINLTKGTGIAGLHGIRNKKGKIIRPLLCFTRFEIEGIVQDNQLAYREDISNADTKYTRNAVRHTVIPELEKINPAFIENVVTSSDRFLELEQILFQKIEEERKNLFVEVEGGFKIEIAALKALTPLKTYLYYFLRTYNFNAADVADILKGLEAQSGQIYYSSTHQIIKDRAYLLLNKIQKEITESCEIYSIEDVPFDARIEAYLPGFKIRKSKNHAYLDADKVKVPLTLRTWANGDLFQPLGMKGNKKVSDFLIDNKVSLIEKKTIKVLTLNNEIVWLVGQRISDKYKVTDSTKRVLIFALRD